MKFLIDFSWFYYQCKNFRYKGNLEFTYATDLDIQGLQDVNKIVINTLKSMSKDESFFESRTTEDKFHKIELQERQILGRILKDYGEEESNIQQNIIECEYIYQIKIKDNKRRLFFIFDKEHSIIKPLIIDLNHLI
ncbi:hypothetical protein [Spiroplasma attinicola]|uniref:hypothetical protein n=1 Tax=Spiroplasma attinicola TaxID=2904537 RepID=UPI002022A9BF|nr:hypothetical protein [Spiroplasma sp. JKS002670]MCL8209823.1 hypothetical protein [Spiroplasma sp. JKS002670]